MKKRENQHIISQVYLKGFGYPDSNNQWKISVLSVSEINKMEKCHKKWINQKSIESFLSENNIFDLFIIAGVEDNLYEKFNSDIENLYPQIIKDLDTEKHLSNISEVALYGIIINLLIRTKRFRYSLNLILKEKAKKDVLIEEIFNNISDGGNVKKKLEIIPKESDLNFFSLLLYERIMSTFSEFQYSILVTDSDEGWFTSDNPVMIKNFVTIDTIFSRNAQIIFPISRNYLVYCFHPSNELKDYKDLLHRSFTKCDIDMKSKITEEFRKYNIRVGSEYYIFPNKFEWK